jgi:hypothetical protein
MLVAQYEFESTASCGGSISPLQLNTARRSVPADHNARLLYLQIVVKIGRVRLEGQCPLVQSQCFNCT